MHNISSRKSLFYFLSASIFAALPLFCLIGCSEQPPLTGKTSILQDSDTVAIETVSDLPVPTHPIKLVTSIDYVAGGDDGIVTLQYSEKGYPTYNDDTFSYDGEETSYKRFHQFDEDGVITTETDDEDNGQSYAYTSDFHKSDDDDTYILHYDFVPNVMPSADENGTISFTSGSCEYIFDQNGNLVEYNHRYTYTDSYVEELKCTYNDEGMLVTSENNLYDDNNQIVDIESYTTTYAYDNVDGVDTLTISNSGLDGSSSNEVFNVVYDEDNYIVSLEATDGTDNAVTFTYENISDPNAMTAAYSTYYRGSGIEQFCVVGDTTEYTFQSVGTEE